MTDDLGLLIEGLEQATGVEEEKELILKELVSITLKIEEVME